MMFLWIIVLGVIVLGILLYANKNGSKILKRESPEDILTDGMPVVKSPRKNMKKVNELLIQKNKR